MNRVQLIGDLVWPVEVWRDPTTGRTFGRGLLAVSVGELDLTFVPLTLQDSGAVDAARYLGEGSRVEVVAHLHSTLVKGRDLIGRRRTRRVLRVIADRVTYLTVRAAVGRPAMRDLRNILVAIIVIVVVVNVLTGHGAAVALFATALLSTIATNMRPVLSEAGRGTPVGRGARGQDLHLLVGERRVADVLDLAGRRRSPAGGTRAATPSPWPSRGGLWSSGPKRRHACARP